MHPTNSPSRTERANLWAVCGAQFVSLAGMTAVLPMMPMYLRQIGVHDATELSYWTGLIGAAPFAVAVFFTPIWGSFADRVGHKPMVVRSVFGIALATFGMGLAWQPEHLFAWRALQGAVSGVFPAAVALLSVLTPEPRVGRALAWLQSARSGGSLFGPMIGGVLTDLFGVRPLFFVFGLISAAAGAACAWIIHEPRAAHSSSERTTRTPALALLTLPMWGMLGLIAAFQIVVMASWPTLALFVQEYGIPESMLGTVTGLIVVAAGLPATFCATIWTRFAARVGIERPLAASLLLLGIANAAVAFASRLAFVIPLRLVAGFAVAGFIPLAFEWMNRRVPSDAKGRVASFGSTAMMLGNVLGPLLGGSLAVHAGITSTFWAPGLGLAILALPLAAFAWLGHGDAGAS